MDELTWTKVVSAVALFPLILAASVTPPAVFILMHSTHAHTSQPSHLCRSLLSLLNCFAAGLFIGALFVDLLPDAQASIERAIRLSKGNSSLGRVFNGTVHTATDSQVSALA